MSISKLLGFAQSDSVNDGRVVEGVGEDCVLGTHELLKESGVGVKAARVQDRVLFAVEPGDLVLQILENKFSVF